MSSSETDAYHFTMRTRIVSGLGKITELGPLCRESGISRVFLVTDPGVAAAGHVSRAVGSLDAAGVDVRVFDSAPENPNSDDVATCRAELGDWDLDAFVGLGGGSCIDLAKGCNFVRSGGGTIEDYQGSGTAKAPLLPLIAIPTTAGTGTEVQSYALIEDPRTHQKMACGDPTAAPIIAILDPAVTVSQPRRVTACTGLDAVGHAVESAVTTKRNAASQLYATQSLRLAHSNLPVVLESPGSIEGRTNMLKAAMFAGIAIEHSMLGAAHSMANPLTARYGLPHGLAVGLALPHVVRFNSIDPATAALYAALSREAQVCPAETADHEAIDSLVARLFRLLDVCGYDRTMTAHGVNSADIPSLAADAAHQWTAQFNPRAITEIDFQQIFAAGC